MILDQERYVVWMRELGRQVADDLPNGDADEFAPRLRRVVEPSIGVMRRHHVGRVLGEQAVESVAIAASASCSATRCSSVTRASWNRGAPPDRPAPP